MEFKILSKLRIMEEQLLHSWSQIIKRSHHWLQPLITPDTSLMLSLRQPNQG